MMMHASEGFDVSFRAIIDEFVARVVTIHETSDAARATDCEDHVSIDDYSPRVEELKALRQAAVTEAAEKVRRLQQQQLGRLKPGEAHDCLVDSFLRKLIAAQVSSTIISTTSPETKHTPRELYHDSGKITVANSGRPQIGVQQGVENPRNGIATSISSECNSEDVGSTLVPEPVRARLETLQDCVRRDRSIEEEVVAVYCEQPVPPPLRMIVTTAMLDVFAELLVSQNLSSGDLLDAYIEVLEIATIDDVMELSRHLVSKYRLIETRLFRTDSSVPAVRLARARLLGLVNSFERRLGPAPRGASVISQLRCLCSSLIPMSFHGLCRRGARDLPATHWPLPFDTSWPGDMRTSGLRGTTGQSVAWRIELPNLDNTTRSHLQEALLTCRAWTVHGDENGSVSKCGQKSTTSGSDATNTESPSAATALGSATKRRRTDPENQSLGSNIRPAGKAAEGSTNTPTARQNEILEIEYFLFKEWKFMVALIQDPLAVLAAVPLHRAMTLVEALRSIIHLFQITETVDSEVVSTFLPSACSLGVDSTAAGSGFPPVEPGGLESLVGDVEGLMPPPPCQGTGESPIRAKGLYNLEISTDESKDDDSAPKDTPKLSGTLSPSWRCTDPLLTMDVYSDSCGISFRRFLYTLLFRCEVTSQILSMIRCIKLAQAKPAVATGLSGSQGSGTGTAKSLLLFDTLPFELRNAIDTLRQEVTTLRDDTYCGVSARQPPIAHRHGAAVSLTKGHQARAPRGLLALSSEFDCLELVMTQWKRSGCSDIPPAIAGADNSKGAPHGSETIFDTLASPFWSSLSSETILESREHQNDSGDGEPLAGKKKQETVERNYERIVRSDPFKVMVSPAVLAAAAATSAANFTSSVSQGAGSYDGADLPKETVELLKSRRKVYTTSFLDVAVKFKRPNDPVGATPKKSTHNTTRSSDTDPVAVIGGVLTPTQFKRERIEWYLPSEGAERAPPKHATVFQKLLKKWVDYIDKIASDDDPVNEIEDAEKAVNSSPLFEWRCHRLLNTVALGLYDCGTHQDKQLRSKIRAGSIRDLVDAAVARTANSLAGAMSAPRADSAGISSSPATVGTSVACDQW